MKITTAYSFVALISVLQTLESFTAYAHDLILIPTGTQVLTMKFGHPGEYEAPDRDRQGDRRSYNPRYETFHRWTFRSDGLG